MLLFLRQMGQHQKNIFSFIHLSLSIHLQWSCSRFTHSRVARGRIQPLVGILWVSITAFSLILTHIIGSKSLVQELFCLMFIWGFWTSTGLLEVLQNLGVFSGMVMAPSKQLLNDWEAAGNVQIFVEKLRSYNFPRLLWTWEGLLLQ